MAQSVDTDVVVVGGGTVGLTTSLCLSRLGIRHTLLERRSSTSTYPRAIGLAPRTMELFRGLGLAEAVGAVAAPLTSHERTAWYTSFDGPTDLHGRRFAERHSWGRGPYLAEYAATNPVPWRILAQIRLEPLLRQAAEASPLAAVRFGWEVTGIGQDDDTVTATGTSGDRPFEVSARYLVGADGGRGVAALVGITETGPSNLVDMVSLHFAADLSKHHDPGVLMSWFVNPDFGGSIDTGILYPVGPWDAAGRSAQFVFAFARGANEPTVFDESAALTRLKSTLGIEDFEPKLLNISHWFLQCVIADRYRAGRVFLAGDAAHRVPPWGGLGMNTGLQDVQNLAWKLAAAIGDPAVAGLLDSYEQERRPIALNLAANAMASFHASLGLIDHALELDPTDPASGWAHIRSVLDGGDGGERRRRALDDALVALDSEFRPHGAESGFFYDRGAFQPQPEEPLLDEVPAVVRDPLVYTPRALPGHHLPHFWLPVDGAPTRQRSTIDLPQLSRFVLIVDEAAGSWGDAAARLDHPLARSLTVSTIAGDAVSPDHDTTWSALREVGPTGALLVRPDGMIAWRWPALPADPPAALTDALNHLAARASADAALAPARP